MKIIAISTIWYSVFRSRKSFIWFTYACIYCLWLHLQFKLAHNVRRYVHVGAASRWRVFLHSWCDAGIWCWFGYSRVGKNRDTSRGTPAGAGAGRTADHLAIFFSQKVLAVRSGNCIYRPVSVRYFSLLRCLDRNAELVKIKYPIMMFIALTPNLNK